MNLIGERCHDEMVARGFERRDAAHPRSHVTGGDGADDDGVEGVGHTLAHDADVVDEDARPGQSAAVEVEFEAFGRARPVA